MKKHLYINGSWKSVNTYKPLYAPYSEETLAEIAQGTEEDVKEAVTAAKNAMTKMNTLSAYDRATILEKVAQKMDERREEFAEIIAKEAAKPIRAARGEVDRTVQTYKFAAEEAKRIYGETLPLDAAPGADGRIAYTIRKPIGVIGAITPFNFPLNLVAHKVGPAIAAGNTVVLKPADQTPLSSYALVELFEEAGLPNGALNIISGPGPTVGEAIVKNDYVASITFTGSPKVGMGIKQKAGLKRVTLELGSNAAVIIDEDVELTDEIIERVKWGAFVNNGQVCISVQRVFVHDTKIHEFLSKLKKAMESVVVGDPLLEETDVSALISKKDVERIDMWVQEAIKEGATVLCGGKKQDARIFEPTVLTNVPDHVSVQCQEVFGPLMTVNTFKEFDEAIEQVNNSRYGLQAGVFTNNLFKAMRAIDELEVGGVMINDIPTFRVDHMPYGGVKESGTGREGIKYAIEEMTEMKLVCIKK
ncbi:TPA: aldehyde dehydrogenase family protein [Bacillus cereus]|uniref:Aldehyde dehydrogenase n=1 Tax=Bacillus thuringiensis subsp. darmstadiensis TaxID=132264 RepID=A0A9X6P994_BACUD|nr:MULTISPECIES: aldehyde dehydrogenase family protein [Bacillus cereus group]MED2683747.1 aldehyde dehydrogenase family protein [Bacillus thuringiensis]ADH06832.1 succinate-semialdehyde dehydrogenase [Bacillus thuringiensis BMB171]ALZ62050.1 Succinate-semialdehyde dehydrogenase (NADP) GabD [Bacillus cereus]EKS7861946.1 aldehyde dehydrogenase family protein [Bacillus cereus]EKS7864831.1 aldehyde dehydrogenase family protein [Bacillus cereus]